MARHGVCIPRWDIPLIKVWSCLKGIRKSLICLKSIPVTAIQKSIDHGEVQMLFVMVSLFLISIFHFKWVN